MLDVSTVLFVIIMVISLTLVYIVFFKRETKIDYLGHNELLM